MTNELIQIQDGKVNFGVFDEVVATPQAGSGCGGGCGCASQGGGCGSQSDAVPAFDAPANFIPLTAVAQHNKLELADVRSELQAKSGPEYWRSLNELAQKPEFEAMVEREFPGGAPASWQGVSRRNFLRLMGASLAMAGLAGCVRQPEERIFPYVKQPEDLIPGNALFFASAHSWNGYGRGVLVESHMGRPTKIEGNPDHPSSLGATDAITQAALLTMYDPERSQSATKNGENSDWAAFMGEANTLVSRFKSTRGAGLRILTETVTSPTLTAQIAELQRQLPEARWHVWEPAGFDNARVGARMAFGSESSVNYRFAQADVIVSLDSDFLMSEPGSVRFAREYADGRRVRTRSGQTKMNRLYSFESTPNITGANADHNWPVRASEIGAVAQALLTAVAGGIGSAPVPVLPASIDAKALAAVAADLRAARGRSVVIAGANQPAELHALVFAINAALGNIGKTVLVTEPVESTPSDSLQSLKNLVTDMNAGRVETLVIVGSNPVYTAPADLKFLDAFKKVATRIRLGLYNDETSNWCHWHLPQSHFLEEWSDIRAHDGTVSIVQPLIEPLYSTVSVHQLFSVLTGRGSRDDYNIVREYWQTRAAGLGGANFETWWRKALNDGIIAGTQAKAKSVSVGSLSSQPSAPVISGLEITFHPDPYIRDGRDANNGWLQELPRPMTKITWDNAALLSVNTARKLNLNNYEMVKITTGGASLEMPVWIMPGQPDDSVAVHLGYGRTRVGKVGEGTGFDTYTLRSSTGLWFAGGVKIEKTNGKLFTLAITQEHHRLDTTIPGAPASGQKRGEGSKSDTMDSFHDRDIIRVMTLDELKKKAQGGHGHDDGHGEAVEGGHGDDHGKAAAGAHGDDHGKTPKGNHADEAHGEGQDKKGHGGGHHAHPNLMPPVWPSDRLSVDANGVPEYDPKPEGYAGNPVPAWSMAIDLNTCIGCNACTAACQAENNISVVGKDEVIRGREMHWIRIDRYYRGDVSNPESYHQPVACMHCEKAPCEPVCPVAATAHSAEGINEMTYNRCVGTKYCSNNCPYKVRRFNYLQYSQQDTTSLQMMANPDVTVRSRGVMEKCTFCIQRINEVRVQAEKENRPIRDGELKTACQQVCPTNAIIFGNVTDKKSAIYAAKAEPHNYSLLEELNTLPRTTYLAKLRNPNPALKA